MKPREIQFDSDAGIASVGGAKTVVKRLKIAVVGCGIGSRHARAAKRMSEHFELVAICDSNREQAKQLAAELGGVRCETDYDVLLRDIEVDLVSICTPPHTHSAMIEQALSSGCHVLCEKPLVNSLEELDRLERLARRTQRQLIPVFQMRYGTGLQQLKHLVEQGITGRSYLTTVETAWRRGKEYFASPWRRSWQGAFGGAVISHAVHAHDMLCYINGPVARLHAFAKTLVNPVETEDCVVASVEMADQSVASLAITLGSATETSRLRFCFERLTAESNIHPYEYSSKPWTFVGQSAAIDSEISAALRDFEPGAEGYDAQLAEAHAVIAGHQGAKLTLADARAAIELASAMYHSAHHNLPVELPLSCDHPAYRGFQPADPVPFGTRSLTD